MSDPLLDALADSAANRGLKLVRSRVRTPGKRQFGKVGLTDKSGKPVFGVDARGPTAKPDEVEAYLRDLGAGDWGASLGQSVPEAKHRAPARAKAPTLKPAPQPKLAIRAAKATDAKAIVGLNALLEHDTDEAGVRKRIAELTRDKLAPLVATLGKTVVGLCGIDAMTAIHRDQPVGRINILVVVPEARGRDIGRRLVEAAEDAMRKRGCGLLEITSNDRLTEAHAFYRHMGFERTSIRFAKVL